MNINQFSGKSIALVMWGENDVGEDDVAVFSGEMRVEGKELFFYRNDDEVHFKMPFDDLERIKPVPPDLKETLLGCEYFVNLVITSLPEDENPDEFTGTGLKWPE